MPDRYRLRPGQDKRPRPEADTINTNEKKGDMEPIIAINTLRSKVEEYHRKRDDETVQAINSACEAAAEEGKDHCVFKDPVEKDYIARKQVNLIRLGYRVSEVRDEGTEAMAIYWY